MSTSSGDKNPPQLGDNGHYKVGYGKPPKEHQFKPGQSGNPKGGKKAAKTLEDLIFKEAGKLINVKMGGEAITINKRQALVKALFTKAINGDLRALQLVFSLLSEADAKLLAAEAQTLSTEEVEILKDLFGKHYVKGSE